MATDFVPLSNTAASPATAAKSSFRVSVVSGASHPEAFRPLQSASGSAAQGQSLAGGPGPAGKPKISLQREGDQVTQIRIECACGEVILLDCQY